MNQIEHEISNAIHLSNSTLSRPVDSWWCRKSDSCLNCNWKDLLLNLKHLLWEIMKPNYRRVSSLLIISLEKQYSLSEVLKLIVMVKQFSKLSFNLRKTIFDAEYNGVCYWWSSLQGEQTEVFHCTRKNTFDWVILYTMRDSKLVGNIVIITFCHRAMGIHQPRPLKDRTDSRWQVERNLIFLKSMSREKKSFLWELTVLMK